MFAHLKCVFPYRKSNPGRLGENRKWSGILITRTRKNPLDPMETLTTERGFVREISAYVYEENNK